MTTSASSSVGFPSPSPEAIDVPTRARRWNDQVERWIETKQRVEGRYLGRPGHTVSVQLKRWGSALEAAGMSAAAEQFGPEHLATLAPLLGRAGKTKRISLSWLGSFLATHGNRTVQASGLSRIYSAKPGPRRWLTEAQLSAVMDAAVDMERVVIALEGFAGLRRKEVAAVRLEDLRLDTTPATLWVRGKGSRDTPSRCIPLCSRAVEELARWSFLRAKLKEGRYDSGHLVAWADGDRLHGWHPMSFDRLVKRAGARAGVVCSNHDLRRTFGRILYNRGAKLTEIRDLYGHASVEMTEHYIGIQEDRMAEAVRLLDAVPVLAR